jgi:hypothetical protein
MSTKLRCRSSVCVRREDFGAGRPSTVFLAVTTQPTSIYEIDAAATAASRTRARRRRKDRRFVAQ